MAKKLPPDILKTLATKAEAAAKEQAKKDKQKQIQKKKEESLIKKVGRKLREIYYGPTTYLPKKRKSTVKPAVRTKVITKSLRSAGLTQKEINKLRGKK